MTNNDPFAGESAPKVDPDELSDWVLFEDEDFLVVNKPGWLVCHPSKDGPWSSLVGACREYCELEQIHLVSRLDRETSGVVLLAKNKQAGSFAQKAVQARLARRSYLTLLTGETSEPLVAEGWLGNDPDSEVFVKQRVTKRSAKAKRSCTKFEPLFSSGGFTLAAVRPETGRKHQIRVHAQWLGFPLVGEKLYGVDETLYLEFITHGWTPRLDEILPMKRQALHAATFVLESGGRRLAFAAPLSLDIRAFCRTHMGLDEIKIARIFEEFLKFEGFEPAKRIGNEGRLV
ncbi:MAG: RNA pseudouridine synthase [Opitutales bacterium]|jgi:23S rRNA pseudouridine1911/1915/1917 synthase